VSLSLDGSRVVDLSAELVARAGLQIDQEVSSDELEWLIEEDEPYRARARALRLLAFRDRSQHEVEIGLTDSGISPKIATETVDWLIGLGYLDDARYVKSLAASKLRVGWGRRQIREELLRRGVDRGLVVDLLCENEGDGSLQEAAAQGKETVFRTACRKFGYQFASDPRGARRRAASYLMRRGYSWAEIEPIVQRMKQCAEEVAEGDKSPD